MRKLILFLVTCCLYVGLSAQTMVDWQSESFLNYAVNPALLTEVSDLNISAQHARKWRGLRSSPVSYNFSAVMPFQNDRMGLGLMINANDIGPLQNNSFALHYAYAFPIGLSDGDKLSLGLSARMTFLRFDQSEFIAGDLNDQLIDGGMERTTAPPNANVGFHYISGKADYMQPVQLFVGGSFARFIPFADRFNTLVYHRSYQWYGMAGLDIYLFEKTHLEASFLLSDLQRDFFHKAFRTTLSHETLGWVSLQYNDRRDFMSQLGLNIKVGPYSDDVVQLVGSYTMSFSTVSSQLGNGLSLGVNYVHRMQRQ